MPDPPQPSSEPTAITSKPHRERGIDGGGFAETENSAASDDGRGVKTVHEQEDGCGAVGRRRRGCPTETQHLPARSTLGNM